MKKLLALLLCIVMAFSLAACSGSVTTVDNTNTDSGDDGFDSAVDESPTTTEAPKEDDWILKYYVDDYDQPTSDWYITNSELITGKFSNSATTNSKLSVRVVIDSNYICFVLYEYGSHQVKNSYSKNRYYDMRMKDADGVEHELGGGIVAGGDRILLSNDSRQKVLTALKKQGTLSFYIAEADRTTTNYRFSMEISNLGEMIK